jgi:glycerol-3-phosphate dehydrogenase
MDLCARQLGGPAPGAVTDRLPLFGGDIASVEAFLAAPAEHTSPAPVPAAAVRALRELYGTVHHEVLALAADRPELAAPLAEGASTIGAQVVYAVRAEMARRLADVVLRRTELGTAGYPGDAATGAAARLAAAELGWTPERTRAEVRAVRAVYERMGALAGD